MKVFVKKLKSNISDDSLNLLFIFLKFLQTQFPLNHDLKVLLVGERTGSMSTGSRSQNMIKILTKKRINRDILRTVAHEWVHEHQRNILGRDRGPDIGGQNEDEANAFAGSLIKKFEKKYPQFKGIMYE